MVLVSQIQIVVMQSGRKGILYCLDSINNMGLVDVKTQGIANLIAKPSTAKVYLPTKSNAHA